MITEEQLIAAGVDKLSKILLSLYINNPNLQKQLDIIFAGLEEDPKKLVSAIKQEISSLKRSTGFVDYYGSDALADRLDQLRLRIIEDLTKKSSEDALKLMHDFLNLHAKTIERCDDSNGTVAGVFTDSCKGLGEIYTKVNKPVEEVVQVVFDIFMKDDYCICDDVIFNFKEALGKEGLSLLYSKFKKSDRSSYKIIQGLKHIADCQKNIEAYIEACNLKHSRFPDHDYIEIATRLIDTWKAQEALEWLDKVDTSNNAFQTNVIPLKIKALELNGNYAQAEQERILWFDKTLSPEVYGQILSNAKPEFKELFKKSAVEKAFNFPNPHVAINFFIEAQEFEECGKFVYLKIDQLSGDSYYTLRPAAKILQQLDPLASTLLYRKMIQPVLDKAKSKYYNYAAQDLALCAMLSNKVTNWQGYESHDIYFKQIMDSHKRKVSFWPQYNKALEKHNAKAKKAEEVSNSEI
jgi:hypothetical protein